MMLRVNELPAKADDVRADLDICNVIYRGRFGGSPINNMKEEGIRIAGKLIMP